MALSAKHLHDALRTVKDPDLGKDLITLGMVKDVVQEGNDVLLVIELTTPACPMKEKIRGDIDAAIRGKAADTGQPLGKLEIQFTADVRKANHRRRDSGSALPDVKHIIAVGAGKGGVGKSTIATNLAVGLARFGAKVGLLDADIYGPSLPTLLGLAQVPAAAKGNMLLPFEVHGIRAMTLGKLVDADKALIWRGPMAHGAFKQLALQTEWGELDYLVIDLPPGTGDVPLTMSQLLPLTGAVVVCTPQKVAQDDARRAVKMFEQLGIPLLGVVENMSYFVGDDGKEYDLFGKGGAEEMAAELELHFLGRLPIHMDLRKNSDAGAPLRNWSQPQLGAELDAICQQTAARVSTLALTGELVQPTVSVK